MDTESLRAADRAHVWHPFTQMRGWQSEEAPIIERGEGSLLFDTDGNAYIDGVSSLWCNVLGHRQPQIDAAIRAQLDKVAHTTMLGLSHPSAIELAQRLVAVAPPGLSRVFFSDNGSTAAEVAHAVARRQGDQQAADALGDERLAERARVGDEVRGLDLHARQLGGQVR